MDRFNSQNSMQCVSYILVFVVLGLIVLISIMAMNEPYNYPPDYYAWNRMESIKIAYKYIHDHGVSEDIKLTRALIVHNGIYYKMPDGSIKTNSQGVPYTAKRLFDEYFKSLGEFKNQLGIHNVDDYEYYMRNILQQDWGVALSIKDVRMMLYTNKVPPQIQIRMNQGSTDPNEYIRKKFATLELAQAYIQDPNISNDTQIIRLVLLEPLLFYNTSQIDAEYMNNTGLKQIKDAYKIQTRSELENKIVSMIDNYLKSRILDYQAQYTRDDLYRDYYVAWYTNEKFDTLENAYMYIHDHSVSREVRIVRSVILAKDKSIEPLDTQVKQILDILPHLNEIYNIKRVNDFESQILTFMKDRGYYESMPHSLAMEMLLSAMYVKNKDDEKAQIITQIVDAMYPQTLSENKQPSINTMEHILSKPTWAELHVMHDMPDGMRQPLHRVPFDGNRFASVPS